MLGTNFALSAQRLRNNIDVGKDMVDATQHAGHVVVDVEHAVVCRLERRQVNLHHGSIHMMSIHIRIYVDHMYVLVYIRV